MLVPELLICVCPLCARSGHLFLLTCPQLLVKVSGLAQLPLYCCVKKRPISVFIDLTAFIRLSFWMRVVIIRHGTPTIPLSACACSYSDRDVEDCSSSSHALFFVTPSIRKVSSSHCPYDHLSSFGKWKIKKITKITCVKTYLHDCIIKKSDAAHRINTFKIIKFITYKKKYGDRDLNLSFRRWRRHKNCYCKHMFTCGHVFVGCRNFKRGGVWAKKISSLWSDPWILILQGIHWLH